jgi:hypothetical protein
LEGGGSASGDHGIFGMVYLVVGTQLLDILKGSDQPYTLWCFEPTFVKVGSR